MVQGIFWEIVQGLVGEMVWGEWLCELTGNWCGDKSLGNGLGVGSGIGLGYGLVNGLRKHYGNGSGIGSGNGLFLRQKLF